METSTFQAAADTQTTQIANAACSTEHCVQTRGRPSNRGRHGLQTQCSNKEMKWLANVGIRANKERPL